jgi:hypothetical protein
LCLRAAAELIPFEARAASVGRGAANDGRNFLRMVGDRWLQRRLAIGVPRFLL